MKTTLGFNSRLPRSARALKLGSIAILLALATSGLLPGAQLTLQHSWTRYPDGGRYYDAADSWMQEGLKSSNHGDETLLKVEYHDGLGDSSVLRFGLPSLTHEGVTAATLSLFYYDYYNMSSSEWLQIKPYRMITNWAEMGVTYRHRDKNATPDPWFWTTEDWAGWYDKADDGDEVKQLKRLASDPPPGIPVNNWVDFNVQPTVALWDGGTTNAGFGVYEFNANDNLCGGMFYANQYEGDWSQHPKLTITYWRGRISWCGFSGSTWDNSSGNWNVGGLVGTYGDGDFVTFADGASNPSITVAGGGVAPGSVTINNASTSYSFSGGSINGSGGLTKQGTGQATLYAPNGYGGQTLVKAGVLVVAADSALGTTGSGTVVSNGAALGFQGSVNYSTAEPLTLAGAGGGGGGALYAVSGNNVFAGPVTLAANSTVGVATSLSLTLNGAISGGFSFTKTGEGRLSLVGTSPNTYSGSTLINGGTFVLSGAATIPNSPVIDVGAGATLDVTTVIGGFSVGATATQTLKGSGTVNGNVAAKSLARLEPGESPGTLTFLNNLTLSEGVTNYFELTNSLAVGGGINDLIVVGGDLTLSSNVIAITVLGSSPLGSGSYRLLNYAGAKTGFFNPAPLFLSGAPGPGTTATIDESTTNQINLVIVAPVATTTALSSTPNPSLPGSNVTFTATVSAVSPATNVPTGSVTFKTNSVPLSTPVPLINGVARLDTAQLPHGFTTVWAEYPGQSLFLGSTGSVVQLVNAPPIPGYHAAYVMKNEALSLSVATLLAGDLDPDSDPLTLVKVSALSTNGGTAAVLDGAEVAYLPKPDYVGSDLLSYTLGDPYTSVTGSIRITVLSTADLTNSILGITNHGGGAVTIAFTGIPGWTYCVQAATNITPPASWQTLSTNCCGTNGCWEFTDLGATNTERYYRSATPTKALYCRLYDAELLQLDITQTTLRLRESPTLASLGVTRSDPQTSSMFVISSFFDVFTELSLNSGITWSPATNGSIPMILVGGAPLNEFAGDTLPPLAGQYTSPPDAVQLYPQGLVIKNLLLRDFSGSFPPPAPGQSKTLSFAATADLSVSFDGGRHFIQYSAPGQVTMKITARLSGP